MARILKPRFLAVSLVAGMLFSASCFGAEENPLPGLMKLKGEELDKAVQHLLSDPGAKYSTSDLMLLAEHATQESNPQDQTTSRAVWMLFQIIGNSGDATLYDRLLKVYLSIPAAQRYGDIELINPLYTLWMKREIAVLKEKPPHVVFAPYKDVRVERLLRHEWPELLKAWSAYQSVAKPYRKIYPVMKPKEDEVHYFQGNEEGFFKIVDDFLQGRGENVSQEMLKYYWGGWCGTGSEEMTYPQTRMLVMAFAREGRLKEAMGAVLMVPHYSFTIYEAETPPDNLTGEFLAACGLDWEEILAGRVFDGLLNYSLMETSRDFHVLSRYGSPRAARLIEQMQLFIRPDDEPMWLNAMAAFISPRPGAPEKKKRPDARISEEPVPDELQDELFRLVLEKMKPDAATDTLSAGIEICSRLHRAEAKDALRVLLKNPSGKIVAAAAAALEELGEKTDVVPNNDPVKFQLLLNGKPLADTDVQWTLEQEPSISMGNKVRTDGEGMISLDREDYVDPTHKPKTITFEPATGEQKLDAVYFRAELQPPRDINVVTAVKLTTFAVVFDITPNRVQEFYKNKQMVLWLRGDRIVNSEFKMDATTRVEVPSLPPGKYEAEIRVPGSRIWHSKFTVEGDTEVKAKLEPGADVIMAFEPGDKGEYEDITPVFFKEGKVFSDYTNAGPGNYTGFPPGKYQFYVPNKKETYAGKIANNPALVLKQPLYKKYMHEFVVNADPEPVVGLGKIALKSPPAQDRK